MVSPTLISRAMTEDYRFEEDASSTTNFRKSAKHTVISGLLGHIPFQYLSRRGEREDWLQLLFDMWFPQWSKKELQY